MAKKKFKIGDVVRLHKSIYCCYDEGGRLVGRKLSFGQVVDFEWFGGRLHYKLHMMGDDMQLKWEGGFRVLNYIKSSEADLFKHELKIEDLM